MKRIFILPMLTLLLAMSGCATAVMSGAANGDDADYPTVSKDAEITREVRMRIYRDPLLSDERIQVFTAQGVVTLRGSVDNRMHINRAMDIARGIEGVRGVNIELRLNDTP